MMKAGDLCVHVVKREMKTILQRLTEQEEAGFTLVEILVALIVITMLAVAGLGVYGKFKTRAQATSILDWGRSLEVAIESFRQDVGMVPASFKDLVEQPSDTTKYPGCNLNLWNGPYVDKGSVDTSAETMTTPIGKYAKWCRGSGCSSEQACKSYSLDSNGYCYGFVIQGLKKDVAQELDKKVDKGDGDSSGRVRWNTSSGSSDFVDLCYFIACEGS